MNEYFEDFDIFDSYIAVYAKNNMRPCIVRYCLKTQKIERSILDENSGDITPCLNKEFKSESLRFEYSGLLVPRDEK